MTDVAETLAPWAQVVPGAGAMTVDDLLTMPDDEDVVPDFSHPVADIFDV